MPRLDKNGNVIYTQAEYQHEVMMGNTFKGFVEGIGYMFSEVVITTHPINASGTQFVNAVHSIQYPTTAPSSQKKQSTNQDIENEIKDYVTQNGVFKDPTSNKIYPLRQGSSVDVKISGDDVNITYKSSSDPNNIQTIAVRISLDHLIANSKPSRSDLRNAPNIEDLVVHNIEDPNANHHLHSARTLRSSSSKFFSVEKMITPAVRSMERKIRQSMIKGVTPPSKHPVWLEKTVFKRKIFDSRTALPKIKIPGSITMSTQTLRTTAKSLKYGGYTLGGIGLVFTGIDMYENGFNRNNSTQFVMGVVAMIPQTRVVSMVYFMGNFALSFVGDKLIEDYVDEYTNQVVGGAMMQQLNQSPPAGAYFWTNNGLQRY